MPGARIRAGIINPGVLEAKPWKNSLVENSLAVLSPGIVRPARGDDLHDQPEFNVMSAIGIQRDFFNFNRWRTCFYRSERISGDFGMDDLAKKFQGGILHILCISYCIGGRNDQLVIIPVPRTYTHWS